MASPKEPDAKDEGLPKATQINLRCTYEEEAAVQSASEVLGVSVSNLIEFGLVQAVTDLGMVLFDDAAPKLKVGYQWPFAPKRPDGESARARLIAYIPAILHPTITSAAWAVRLSIPQFAVGSALRQISLAKLINERRQKSEPGKYDPRLAKIAVPYDFDDLVKSTRH